MDFRYGFFFFMVQANIENNQSYQRYQNKHLTVSIQSKLTLGLRRGTKCYM